MKKTASLSFLFWLLLSASALCQVSQIVPFQQPGANPAKTTAYQPIPIIMVHGITAGRDTWNAVLNRSYLQYYLSDYAWTADPVGAGHQDPGQNILYSPNDPSDSAYLNTFDYGVYGNPKMVETEGHLQTMDDVSSNAWAGVTSNGNNNVTLDERITTVQAAYQRIDGSQPPVILLAHSMGGLVSHAYLAHVGADGSVLRLITLGTPHYGSYLVDVARETMDPTSGGFFHFVGRRLQAFTPSSFGLDIGQADWEDFFHYAYPTTAHPEKTGMQNCTTPQNELITQFLDEPVPGYVEFVFNSFRWNSGAEQLIFNLINPLAAFGFQASEEQIVGDGVVPIWSQEGRPTPAAAPNIMNGNSSSGQPITPVIFGETIDPNAFSAWEHFHSGEATVLGVSQTSLCAVVYSTSTSFGENFSKYLPPSDELPDGSTVYHTDEPGIGTAQLVYQPSSGPNPLLIPALDTWTTNGTPSIVKGAVGMDYLAGHQIVGPSSGSGSVTLIGTVGAKNSVPDTFTYLYDPTSGLYTQVIGAGNEYLPDSLLIDAQSSTAPMDPSPTYTVGAPSVSRCLAILDDQGNPQSQYGYFEQSSGLSFGAGPNYVAVQAYQTLAGLYTRQAERAFDVPVDSATVVALLQGINNAEAQIINNPCHNVPPYPTRWTATINEWVNPTSSSFALDFFPTEEPTQDWYLIQDAFTDTVYTNWTYDDATKTFTLTDPANAPSRLLVSYDAYLGTLSGFQTNYYPGGTIFTVPPLANNTLAGVPIGGLLGQMHSALDNIIPIYDQYGSCAPWTKTNVLAAAGVGQGMPLDWTPVSNGVVQAINVTEMQPVLSLLTEQDYSCDWCWVLFGQSPYPEQTNTITITVSGLSIPSCTEIGVANSGWYYGLTVLSAPSLNGTFTLNSVSGEPYEWLADLGPWSGTEWPTVDTGNGPVCADLDCCTDPGSGLDCCDWPVSGHAYIVLSCGTLAGIWLSDTPDDESWYCSVFYYYGDYRQTMPNQDAGGGTIMIVNPTPPPISGICAPQ